MVLPQRTLRDPAVRWTERFRWTVQYILTMIAVDSKVSSAHRQSRLLFLLVSQPWNRSGTAPDSQPILARATLMDPSLGPQGKRGPIILQHGGILSNPIPTRLASRASCTIRLSSPQSVYWRWSGITGIRHDRTVLPYLTSDLVTARRRTDCHIRREPPPLLDNIQ